MAVNVAEKMRVLAFSNEQVKKLYKEAISEINIAATGGDLYCIIDNDETVREMLIREGFSTEEVVQTNKATMLDYKKLKISW